MNDKNTGPNSDSGFTAAEDDEFEHDEDQREEAQLNESLEKNGLLPLPDAEPADGPAPGA